MSPRRVGPVTSAIALLAALALMWGTPPAASAADSLTPTSLRLTTTAAYAGNDSRLTIRLTAADGAAVPDAEVTLGRRRSGVWHEIRTLTTGADGTATTTVVTSKKPADNKVRARYADDPTHAPLSETGRIELKRRTGVVRVTGPGRVVDERRSRITVTWRARNGDPVVGKVVLYRKRPGQQKFHRVRALTTNGNGRATTKVRPRSDTRWRAKARALPWVTGDTSGTYRLDNLPPGKPVRLPKRAPRPRRTLPAQAHAVGAGAHPVITRIPNRIWRQMTGLTWHAGCPVGRSGLRLLRINYWDYSGYRRRGELVAAAGAIRQMSRALSEMYAGKYPIRSMYRVDRFGWSKRSHGGNDYASMAAGNTSAFNCRDVTGSPGVRSPHSYGRALDLNTWENPYRSAKGLVPDRWWQAHSHPRVAWRSRRHAVVRIMARHGLRWTYGLGDTQHFDAAVNGRILVVPGCRRIVCD